MQSPGAKRKTKQKAKTKTSSGDYYQFSWDEDDLSASDDDRSGSLSPKEYVAKILEETKLSEIPISGHNVSALDLSFDFLPEVTSIASDEARRGILDLSQEGTPTVSYDDEYYRDDSPEKLESPLDHPDSGYIEFLTSPNSSSSLDQARSHSDGLGSSDFHSENESVSSDDMNHLTPTRDKDRLRRNRNDAFIPSIRFRKANFTRLDEDMYIDDDIHTDYMRPMPTERHIVTPIESADKTRSSDVEIGAYLPMPEADITDRVSDPMLNSDEDQHETELDDTNPIILIDQDKLTQQWRQKRKRIKLAVAISAAIFGLIGFAAVVYLLVRFLIML